MSKSLEKPNWYPLEIYEKKLTPEEWLQEIFKRLNLDELLANPFLDSQIQMSFFESIILKNQVKNMTQELRNELPRPIKPLSVFEILRLAFQVLRSQEYQTHPDKKNLETALTTIVEGGTLNQDQKRIVSRFIEIPYNEFLINYSNQNINSYISGLPIAIDPTFDRKDILFEMRRLLNKWQPKKKLRPLSQTIFKSWSEKKVLALFDLQVWYKIKQINYSKMDLARTLWPNPPESKLKDSTVDLKDFIDEALKLTKKVINLGTFRPLFFACESRKAQRIRSKQRE